MSDYISGGRAIFSAGEVGVGWAGGVSGGQDIAYNPIDVLGDLYSKEQIAVGITIRFQCNFFRLIGAKYNEALRVTNDTTSNGKKYLNQAGISALIEDTIVANKKFISASGLKLSARNFDTAARTLFTENATFVGIALDFNDEAAAL